MPVFRLPFRASSMALSLLSDAKLLLRGGGGDGGGGWAKGRGGSRERAFVGSNADDAADGDGAFPLDLLAAPPPFPFPFPFPADANCSLSRSTASQGLITGRAACVLPEPRLLSADAEDAGRTRSTACCTSLVDLSRPSLSFFFLFLSLLSRFYFVPRTGSPKRCKFVSFGRPTGRGAARHAARGRGR